jgi:hypothetical protein
MMLEVLLAVIARSAATEAIHPSFLQRMNDLPQVICPSGVVPIFLSSLISDFPKNISVPS